MSFENLQVGFHKFENEIQILFVGENVNHLNHVWVVKFFQQLDFSKCCHINPFIFSNATNFLYSYRSVCLLG